MIFLKHMLSIRFYNSKNRNTVKDRIDLKIYVETGSYIHEKALCHHLDQDFSPHTRVSNAGARDHNAIFTFVCHILPQYRRPQSLLTRKCSTKCQDGTIRYDSRCVLSSIASPSNPVPALCWSNTDSTHTSVSANTVDHIADASVPIVFFKSMF